jgi:RHS repeat-associated protein
VSGSDTTRYTYDVLGNLLQVVLPSATTIDYLVDGQNRRIGRKVNGVLGQGLLYQGQLSPIAELNGSNQVVSRFVYGTRVNVPEYIIKSGTTYRVLTDHLGSVRLLVNTSTGAIAQRLDYDEVGRVTQNTSPGFQPFGYAGGLYDDATTLVRFGARDYDAETGRWTAQDPIGFEGGSSSLYEYAENDPISLVDPEGDVPIAPVVVGGAISAGVDLGIQLWRSGGDLGAVDWNSVGSSFVQGAVGAAALGTVARWIRTGREFQVTQNFRIAPWGNRTGHPTGRYPHYHRRAFDPNGDVKKGGSIKRHRPWDTRSTDRSFWDRFLLFLLPCTVASS